MESCASCPAMLRMRIWRGGTATDDCSRVLDHTCRLRIGPGSCTSLCRCVMGPASSSGPAGPGFWTILLRGMALAKRRQTGLSRRLARPLAARVRPCVGRRDKRLASGGKGTGLPPSPWWGRPRSLPPSGRVSVLKATGQFPGMRKRGAVADMNRVYARPTCGAHMDAAILVLSCRTGIAGLDSRDG